MTKICVIGPLCKDRNVVKGVEYFAAGGVTRYATAALDSLGVSVEVFPSLSEKDLSLLEALPKGVNVHPLIKERTTCYENIYSDDNLDHCIKSVPSVANPITTDDFYSFFPDKFDFVLLGPLTHTDFGEDVVQYLGAKGNVSVTAQGFFRRVTKAGVNLDQWDGFESYLPHFKIICMNEEEAELLRQGNLHKNLHEIAKDIALVGPNEVIITRGSSGSLIYSKSSDHFIDVPAFPPQNLVDPTGAGDTFLAAYLTKRSETNNIYDAGLFAAMAATAKLETRGPLSQSKEDIEKRLGKYL